MKKRRRSREEGGGACAKEADQTIGQKGINNGLRQPSRSRCAAPCTTIGSFPLSPPSHSLVEHCVLRRDRRGDSSTHAPPTPRSGWNK